ncbi:hypothetical protein Q8A67_025014 [Cirrhinus molitorella]|uniref:Uncharacterized protein n=1 Tax=Cirrhinus molitorella TaxID=172907 RepID=A0AA88NTX1_9TELE|nr:hypothetical protein Q8A67_025014 [Cirrhinus molitorella]
MAVDQAERPGRASPTPYPLHREIAGGFAPCPHQSSRFLYEKQETFVMSCYLCMSRREVLHEFWVNKEAELNQGIRCLEAATTYCQGFPAHLLLGRQTARKTTQENGTRNNTSRTQIHQATSPPKVYINAPSCFNPLHHRKQPAGLTQAGLRSCFSGDTPVCRLE